VKKLRSKPGHVLACCPINIAEVYAGMRPKEQQPLKTSLPAYSISPSRHRPPASLNAATAADPAYRQSQGLPA
jgi:hypothetical protein